MTDAPKVIRCIDCRAEFTEAEIEGYAGCPNCGTRSVPMSISQDTTIRINWHELRILTIWASNWADKAIPQHDSAHTALRCILRELNRQRPEGAAALTIAGELHEMAETMGRTVKRKGDNYILDKKEQN